MNLLDKKLAIFDMDGLLIDSEKYYAIGWARGIAEEGYNINQEIIDRFAGRSAAENTGTLLKFVMDSEVVKRIRARREAYFDHMVEIGEIKPMPYAIEILKFLTQNNFKIALASSTYDKRAKKILEVNKIESYFDYCVFGNMVEKLKPFPDIYQNVLKHFELCADEAFAMEDSTAGILAASNAGISVAVITKRIDLVEFMDKMKIIGVYDNFKNFCKERFSKDL